MAEVEPWVAKTQKELGAVIKAPKLSDKFLQKPPVKFLHDVVTNFLAATGFPAGLYSAEELDPNNLKDRDQKLNFVNKLITVVQVATGKTTQCKGVKVIAGAEAEFTNEVLQMLASCAKLPKDKHENAVKQAIKRRDSTAGQEAPPSEGTPPPTSAPVPAPAPAQAPAQPAAPPPPAQKPAPAPEAPPPQQAKQQPPPPPQAPAPAAQPTPQQQPAPRRQSVSEVPGNLERPGSMSMKQRPQEAAIVPAAGILVEGKDDGDDEHKETPEERAARILRNAEKQKEESSTTEADAKGYFAREAIREKQEDKKKSEAEQEGDTTGGAGGIVLRSRVKPSEKGQRDDFESEIQTLRDQLQTLSKTTNPIGQFMERITEDIDAMVRELEQWKAEYKLQIQRCQDAKRDTEEDMRALRNQLAEMDHSLQDQVQQTNSLRAVVMSADGTIENLLRMVVNSDGVGSSMSGKRK